MTDRKTNRNGKVVLVGAGPGDPGLLTLRGAEVLGRADVVLYDELLDDSVLALAPASAERIKSYARGWQCWGLARVTLAA